MKNILKKYSLIVCLLSMFFMVNSNASAASDYFSEYQDNIRVVLLDSELSSITSVDFTLKGSYAVEGTDTIIGDGAYTIKLESGNLAIYKSGSLIRQFSSGESVNITSQNYSSNLLTLPKTNRMYLGGFSFLNQGTYISIINKLGMEEYLFGVVPAEISESCSAEALKAQAVAARTYAFSKMLSPANTYFDLGNNTNYQVYNGYSAIYPKCKSAVEATKGIVLTYNGQPINAYFCSSNGGYTEKVENVWGSTPLPYSDSVQDSYDPREVWTRTYTTADINSRLSSTVKATIGDFTGIDINSVTRYPSGRVSNITITGTNGSMSFSKNNARMFLAVGNINTDLKSSMYEVTYDSANDTYTFKGTGFGHGVGMSQVGAQNRALAGQKYNEILSFYYPNSTQANYYSLTMQGMIPSNPAVNVGESVTFTTSAIGGNQLMYQYHLYNYQTKAWTVLSDYTASPMLNWTFSAAGKYQVMCFVKDVNSSSQYDAVAYSEVTAIVMPVTLNGMTPAQLETATLKQQTFTVSASGGTSLLYQFHIYNYQTKLWTVATDYTATPALNWTFTGEGKYQVMCFVKDKTSASQYDKVAYSEVTASKPSITLNGMTPSQLATTTGKQETFTVSASGGTTLLYQYHIYNYQTKLWTVATDYTTSPSMKWTFSDTGKYQVMCFVKDSGSAKQYDAVAYCETTVAIQPVVSNGMTPSTLTTYKGKQETFTVSASGGTSLLYQYHIYNYQTKLWTVATDYTASPSMKWTFSDAGKYQVMCFVKDSGSAKQYDAVAYCETTVAIQPVVSNGMTPSTLTTYKGKQETFTVSASGGTSLLYQYHIYNYQTKLWTVATDYTASPSMKWTFSDTGKYQVMCFVKDSGSAKPYDAVAYCETTVAIQPVVSNGMTPSTLTTYKGKQETFAVSASGGTSLLYQYHIYNYQTKLWTVATDYTASPSMKWTFSDTGKYQVMCFVKDSGSAKPYDAVAYCETTVAIQPVVSNGMTPTSLTTYTGKQEAFTVSASGGASLLYQYHIYNYQTQAWAMIQDYSLNPTLKWTFSSTGKYQIMCFIKDASSSKQYDAVAYCEAIVTAPPISISGISPSQLTTTVGEQSTIKVTASGGTSLLYQYHIYNYQTQTWSVVTDYTTNPSLNWTFKAKGNYQILCYVKDKTSINKYDKTASCEAVVNESTTAVAMNTASPTQFSTTAGNIGMYTVNPGTITSPLYQFHIFNYERQTWSMVQDYSTSPSLSWAFDSSGRYQVMCFVKEKTSSKQYDKVAYCEVIAGSAKVYASHTIVIDAGHGGADSGAVGVTGVYEKNVNLPVALKVGALLKASGVNVVYTRTADVAVSLQARCDAANNSGATYLVSIHSNAVEYSSASGVETLYDTTDPESLKLAAAIQKALIAELGAVDRGLKDGNWLYMVNHTNSSCAVALAELGFLTNASEEKLLVTESYQDRCASAIADAIVSCLNS